MSEQENRYRMYTRGSTRLSARVRSEISRSGSLSVCFRLVCLPAESNFWLVLCFSTFNYPFQLFYSHEGRRASTAFFCRQCQIFIPGASCISCVFFTASVAPSTRCQPKRSHQPSMPYRSCLKMRPSVYIDPLGRRPARNPPHTPLSTPVLLLLFRMPPPT